MNATSGNFVRFLTLTATVLLSWAAFVVGGDTQSAGLAVGDVAQHDYVANRTGSVVDEAELQRAQQQEADQIPIVISRDPSIEDEARNKVSDLFSRLSGGVVAPQSGPIATPDLNPVLATTTTTEATTTTTGGDGEGSTTTTTQLVPEEMAVISGIVYLDTDSNGSFEPEFEDAGLLADVPFEGFRMVAVSQETGEVVFVQTDAEGVYSFEVAAGEWEVGIDGSEGTIPDDTTITTDAPVQLVTCAPEEVCSVSAVGIGPRFQPLESQVEALGVAFPDLKEETVLTYVQIARDDQRRRLLGLTQAVPGELAEETLGRLSTMYSNTISSDEELQSIINDLELLPPLVFIDGERHEEAGHAVADVVASFLVVNTFENLEATEILRQEAIAQVDPTEYETQFFQGDFIMREGDFFTDFTIQAITQVGPGNALPPRAGSVGLILAVLVGILAFYLSRFRAQFWHAPRMVALLGLLIVLGSLAVRITSEFQEASSWFVLPAVAFGYLAAVLLDNRMGTIMALAMGVLAAIGTRDAGIAVYASLATLAPIGFVSRVSSRRSFRNSVLTTALVSAAIGAAVAWTFLPAQSTGDPLVDAWSNVGIDTVWAFGAALIASLVALSIMPFFEGLFDITTTLRLLELTDRNHEALQTLQEKAFGTFNHSLMVGTLADAAAKAVGANNLLARAAAYYHDIGKTENPMYFIENQFGTANPHDELPPEESAKIIRGHVLDGIELAEKYKIPSEVSEGILAHHGDAVMRFFYEKARQQYGDENVDINDYRHAGHKPKSREMAIVMMADSVEGACRAVFGEEEPTPEGIEKVVNRIVDEKASDGQLSQSDLTLAQLTAVKSAFIEALVGHYHQRIPYPNFPGS